MLRRDWAWTCCGGVLWSLVFQIVDQCLNWAVVKSGLRLASWNSSRFISACNNLRLLQGLVLYQSLNVSLRGMGIYWIFSLFEVFNSFLHVNSDILEWLEVIVAFEHIRKSSSWNPGRCSEVSQVRVRSISGKFGLSYKFMNKVIWRALTWLWVGSLRCSCQCVNHEARWLLLAVLRASDQVHLFKLLNQRSLLYRADLVLLLGLAVWIFCLTSCATHTTRRKIQRVTPDLNLSGDVWWLQSLLRFPQGLNVLCFHLVQLLTGVATTSRTDARWQLWYGPWVVATTIAEKRVGHYFFKTWVQSLICLNRVLLWHVVELVIDLLVKRWLVVKVSSEGLGGLDLIWVRWRISGLRYTHHLRHKRLTWTSLSHCCLLCLGRINRAVGTWRSLGAF